MKLAIAALALLAAGHSDAGHLLVVLIVIAAIGVIAWLIITYIPMPPIFRGVIIVVAAIAAIFYALSAFDVHL